MKLAIIGSRDLIVKDLNKYALDCDELVSGGAKGVDTCVAEYAQKHNIKLTLFLSEYNLYGKAAPIIRNKKIVDYAEKIVIFWNGTSRGTLSVINYAKKSQKKYEIIIIKE